MTTGIGGFRFRKLHYEISKIAAMRGITIGEQYSDMSERYLASPEVQVIKAQARIKVLEQELSAERSKVKALEQKLNPAENMFVNPFKKLDQAPAA